jgi:CSLREA domain-containing protein
MKKCIKLFFSFCVMFSLTQAIFAATYTVTKIADTNDNVCSETDCSLREAIAAANATADNDTVNFSATVFNVERTIALSGTDLIINSNGTLTINGTGINLLNVSGNNTSRVFTNNTGAVTEIKNLRVTGGNAVSTINTGVGGGIRNSGGTLTLTNVVVTENTATNGGGLSNAGGGILNLNGCTVSGNTASASGGGMQNFSGTDNVMNIWNSTISGNTSSSTTVGGGGIQGNGVLFISNTTISGNAATNDGGGIYYNGQNLTMNNATVANNTANDQTGGFYKNTTNNANFRNNLFAGNTGGASPDVSGAINSLGNNLIQTVGTSTGWTASDILNQFAQIANLSNNGGLTQTHALGFNSPAIDAGNSCVVNLTCPSNNPPVALTIDQRGSPRLSGRSVDIGAFEVTTLNIAFSKPFDFDGDGRTDYGVFRPSNGTWFLNRSSTGLYTGQFGNGGDQITPADFDGDNRTDIAVWRRGAFSFFYILKSSDNTLRIEQFGTTGDDPRVVGDWDGDGKADPAVYREAAAVGGQSFFFYRPSSQPAVDFVPIRWGTAGDEALRGDFDGDGLMDAAIYRARDNTWYISQSFDGQPRYAKWGNSSDKRVEGDFDGDHKTDLVIFRDGLWGVLQSSNGQQLYQQWGTARVRLVPGDYDGDGKTDFAVWRDGIFSILFSNGNVPTTIQFGADDDLPVASAFVRDMSATTIGNLP